MSIRKILDQLSEMATTSGSVASVASPMGATQKRSKDSIFYEGDAVCHTCHQHECQCDANSRKAPESPEVANFGLWKNSILAGKEQKAKKKSRVKESVTDYNPKSQGGTRKELLAKLRSAKSAEEKSDLATRARKAGATQRELQDLSEDQYGGQYDSKEAAIEYAKEKVKSFRDWQDGIEVWAMPSGRFDVVNTSNSNGRNHVIDNGGKKLGTIYPKRPAFITKKDVAEAESESWSIRFMDGGKEDKMTVKAASNREALKKWRAKRPDAEIIGISRAKQVDEGNNEFIVSTLRSAWNSIDRVDPDNPHYNKLIRLLDSLSQETLKELVDAKIKFVSSLARNRLKKDIEESDERLADLTKISTAKLQELVSLHRHAGGNNPLAAKAAKRGAEELLKRGIRVPVDEAKESDELASDLTQRNLKKMADRHGDEQWTIEQLKKLGQKLSAPEKTRRVDELGNSLMPGGQRAVKLAERDVEEGLGDIAKNAVKGAKRFMKGKPTVGQSIDDHESTARGAESKREVFSVTGNSKLSRDMSHQANREHEKAARIKNKFAPLNLAEQDFIINPHDVRRVQRDVVPKIDPRQDHEVEMACSDLFQAAKNAREVLQLIKDIPESQGLEGWVQEKIIKASDYLNTVREYLEGQGVRSAMSGNFNMGNMLDESADNPLESALVRRIMSQHTDALQHYGPTNVLAAIQDVAGDFNPGDELGTSDVSAYVQQVMSYLRNNFSDNSQQLDEVVPEILGLHGVIGGGLAASAAGIAGGAAIAGVGLLISQIKDAATKLVKMAKGGDKEAQNAVDLVIAKLDDSLEESVIAAGLAAGAAGLLAKGLINMIGKVQDRVEDNREAKRVQAELGKVENYLTTASTQLSESRSRKSKGQK